VVWETIRNYTMRVLTYDKDSLNGILGVLRLFEGGKMPIYHFWGVPIFPLCAWPRSRPLVETFGSFAYGFTDALL
jgi:hypothetical protein